MSNLKNEKLKEDIKEKFNEKEAKLALSLMEIIEKEGSVSQKKATEIANKIVEGK